MRKLEAKKNSFEDGNSIVVNETFSCVEDNLTEDVVQLSEPIDDIMSEQVEDTQISLTEPSEV